MSYQNASVLQKNEAIFVSIGTLNLPVIGRTLPVQTALDNVDIIGEYWATPRRTNNYGQANGIFRGYVFRPSSLAKPQVDSFLVTRFKDKLTGDTYHVMVTMANFLAGTLTATSPGFIIPEHQACADNSGNYTYDWAMPFKTGGQNFVAHVSLNGVQQTVSTVQTNLAGLVTWLNANVAVAGSVWSANGTKLHLTGTYANPVGVVIEVQ